MDSSDHSATLAECSLLFTSSATRSSLQSCRGRIAVPKLVWQLPGIGQVNMRYLTMIQPRRLPLGSIYLVPFEGLAAGVGRLAILVSEWSVCLPGFNVLMLFNVSASSVHLVCPVAPIAKEKRLSITGFWHRTAEAVRVVPRVTGTFVSPTVYGQAEAEVSEASPFIVL